MENKSTNIYKRARNVKGITQERAAELLNISVDSLKAYESGRTPVPNTVAADMTTIYGVEHLALQHLRENEVGKMVLPEIKETPLTQAILKLLNQLNDVMKYGQRLIQIGSNGTVDEDEQIDFNNILKECVKLQSAILELQYSKHK